MWEELKFDRDDVIAVIAPHPDDECLGASAALLMAPERTDVYVLSGGSHGNEDRSFEEEAAVRRALFSISSPRICGCSSGAFSCRASARRRSSLRGPR